VLSQGRIAAAALDSGDGTIRLDASTVSDLQNPDSFVRVLGIDGTPIQDPGNTLAEIAADPALIARANDGDTAIGSGAIDGRPMTYVTTPIHDSAGKIVAILQTGASRDDIDELLNLLAVGLVVAAPVVIVMAVVGGYLFAGRVLKPVSEITALAASTSETDLHARLNLALPDDELGRLAQTFDDMLARMEDAFNRQKRFTSDAAHELRTPLSLMRGQLDLALARPRSPEEYDALLREFDTDLTRLTRLVETLLNLTRSDQQGILPDRSEFALDDVVIAIRDQYRDAAAAAGVTLAVEVEPTPVVLDQDLIIQVLVNLVDNALLQTPWGGAMILGCRSTAEEIVLWVRDSGPGIAREYHERIFDRFYRIEESRARRSGGAGLGLAIVKAIVAAQDGTIHLSSQPGDGATFTITFPVGI
jgi:heavy metal sensor kinase